MTPFIENVNNYLNHKQNLNQYEMDRKLKIQEFDRKQKLLDYVNSNSGKLDILSITSSQEVFFYKHFLWYYDK